MADGFSFTAFCRCQKILLSQHQGEDAEGGAKVNLAPAASMADETQCVVDVRSCSTLSGICSKEDEAVLRHGKGRGPKLQEGHHVIEIQAQKKCAGQASCEALFM